MKSAKQPLKVRIEKGQLVISIGIDTLAWAAEQAPYAERYDEESGEFQKKFRVTDKEQFAKDVLGALLNEKEDGSTPVEDAIDKASSDALDDGSTGVEFLLPPPRRKKRKESR